MLAKQPVSSFAGMSGFGRSGLESGHCSEGGSCLVAEKPGLVILTEITCIVRYRNDPQYWRSAETFCRPEGSKPPSGVCIRYSKPDGLEAEYGHAWWVWVHWKDCWQRRQGTDDGQKLSSHHHHVAGSGVAPRRQREVNSLAPAALMQLVVGVICIWVVSGRASPECTSDVRAVLEKTSLALTRVRYRRPNWLVWTQWVRHRPKRSSRFRGPVAGPAPAEETAPHQARVGHDPRPVFCGLRWLRQI